MTRPIVALDVATFDAACALVEQLGDAGDAYKVGLELYAADGPRMVRWLRERGKFVFVDLKAYDIPNTVRGVARSVAALGGNLLTVHATGGRAMIEAAVEGAGLQDGSQCGILAVTVLTSFDSASYAAATGRSDVEIATEVERLASVASSGGAHGIVCSGHEVGRVKARFATLRVLVPGVRPAGSDTHDQARVVTPSSVRLSGAEYAVLGRAVTGAPDPRAALVAIQAELRQEALP